MQIDGATQSWAIDEKKTADEFPTAQNLYGRNAYLIYQPGCPDSGVYTLGSGIKPPTCTHPGHILRIDTNYFKDPRRYVVEGANQDLGL